MKRIWIVGVILSLLSVAAGFSVPLSDEALAAILGQSSGAACPQPPQGSLDLPGQHPGVNMTCSATATCTDTSPGTPVSCNWGGSGGSCTFQNQDCDLGIRGQVNCNGTVTQCPACPCNDTPKCCQCEATGDCVACCRCAGGTIIQCNQECNGG